MSETTSEGGNSPSYLDSFIADLPQVEDITIRRTLTRLRQPNIIAAVEKDERRKRIEYQIREGGKFLEISESIPGRVAICAYGPSLSDFIPQIKEHKANGGLVCTVSGSHDLLKIHGIVPDFHVEMDPRMHKAHFVKNWNPETQYFIATSAHENMFFNLFGADVTKFNVFTDKGDEAFLATLPGNHFCLDVGSVVGLASLVVMCVKGYRDFDIYGMDCSLRNGVRHAGPHNGKIQREQSVMCIDKWFRSTPQLVGAMNDFFNLVPRLGQVNIELHGDGLLQYRLLKLMEKKNVQC